MNGTVYNFKENENTLCFVCTHVYEKEKDILLVAHEKQIGEWKFTCGAEHHDNNSYKIISLKQITVIDNSINEVSAMPKGIGARRDSKNDLWSPFRL